jgi:coenzyme F420-reducing hydrogenase alpha subunit
MTSGIKDRLRRTVEQNAEEDIPALKKMLVMTAPAFDPCISSSIHLLQGHYAF